MLRFNLNEAPRRQRRGGSLRANTEAAFIPTLKGGDFKRRMHKKAFSLLELVLSIGILSIGIITVLQALSFCIRLTGLSNDIVNAALLAEDKMQELEFKEKYNFINKEPAKVQDKSGKFLWGYILTPDSWLNLSKLDFEVTWKRINRKENLKLSTYLR